MRLQTLVSHRRLWCVRMCVCGVKARRSALRIECVETGCALNASGILRGTRGRLRRYTHGVRSLARRQATNALKQTNNVVGTALTSRIRTSGAVCKRWSWIAANSLKLS